jgi:type III secretory pathway component EscS
MDRLAVETLLLVVTASAPPVLIGGAVGLAAALFQAVTSIQESSLSFAPKSAAILATLAILVRWYGALFGQLAARCLQHVADLG